MFHVNKKTITAIIAVCLTCASLAACKDSSNTTPLDNPPINSQQPPIYSEAHFTFVERGQSAPNTLESSDKQILYISATAEKASFVAENRKDRPIAMKMNEVLTQAYERSKNIYGGMVDELDAYLSSEEANDAPDFPWESSADFTCLKNDSKSISVAQTVESKSAGSLLNTTFYTYNFDPASGEQINQLFYIVSDKESFDSADDIMYNKLLEKYGKEIISYDNVTSSFVELAAPCWYFTEEGIHITFNPGTIAPEDAGVLELDYSKEELPEFAQKYFD